MGRYEEALADLDHAIELNPEYISWLAIDRGEAYRAMGRYEEALADFNRGVKLDPEDDWCLYDRAVVRKILDQRNEASTDLKNAIQLAQQSYEKNLDVPNEKCRIAFNQALYHLAAEEIETAESLYQSTLSHGPSPNCIREAIDDLKDFLAVFPNYTQASAIRELLQKYLTNIREPE
jgi:tetratricopeptide (TPR) repeat protein